MANIVVAVDIPIVDGYKLKFRTPCESTMVEGLDVKYPVKNGVGYAIKKFVFKDAHGTELSGVCNLFVSGVMIELLLDVTHSVAYIQNADTNSYLESVKGEIARLEESQKQFLSVAGKSIEECEKAAANANKEYERIKDDVVGKREKDGSEVFNDYDNNQAIGEFTHAEGKATNVLDGLEWSEQAITFIGFSNDVIRLTAKYEDADGAIQDFFANNEIAAFRISNEAEVSNKTHIDVVGVLNKTYIPDEDCWEFNIETPIESLELNGTITKITINALIVNAEKSAVAAHAEGFETLSMHEFAHAEGWGAAACGRASHAEGYNTKAIKNYAHAEGAHTVAGYVAHAEGAGNKALGDYSHAEGQTTIAVGAVSHSEGSTTEANGDYSHAEGINSYANGWASHAEGSKSYAHGAYSHSEGRENTASGTASHVEGSKCEAQNDYAHAEGYNTRAIGYASHVEGNSSKANGYGSHAEGFSSTAKSATYAHSEGDTTTASGMASHAEGRETKAEGVYTHAEGYLSKAIGSVSHAEGQGTTAKGDYSHAEGNSTTASGSSSHAEGENTKASGAYSHAEGVTTTASGSASHAEGNGTTARGNYSHAEGQFTTASGAHSHAEGFSQGGIVELLDNNGAIKSANTLITEWTNLESNKKFSLAYGVGSHVEGGSNLATGQESHAEGYNTLASGQSSHAEGYNTHAAGLESHAEGHSAVASGLYSHAEGYYTEASGWSSHAGGCGAKATGNSQTAIGKFNEVEDDALFIIGNGTEDTKRKTALSVKNTGAIKAIAANQRLVSGGFIEYGRVLGNSTFKVSDYTAICIIDDVGNACHASVRKESYTDNYIIEGTYITNHNTDTWSSEIRSLQIHVDSSSKISAIDVKRVKISSGEVTVSGYDTDTIGYNFAITQIIGLVPISGR